MLRLHSYAMELSDVVRVLNEFCLTHLAEKWDNTGLLVEPSPPLIVQNILFTNDLTEPVLNEALSKKANLIISYHPPIFTPLKRLSQATWKERIIVKCLENRVAVYSPHTSLDAKCGGINDWLLSPFEISTKKSLSPVSAAKSLVRLIVKMTGMFGEFVLCSSVFVLATHILGVDGFEAEVTCSEEMLEEVNSLAQKCRVPIISRSKVDETISCGYGRLASLKLSVNLAKAIESYKLLCGLKDLVVSIGYGKTLDSSVTTIAVCAGAGGSLLCRTPSAFVADLFVTGELSHHDRLEAVSRGISVIITGHSNCERGFLSERFIPGFRSLLNSSVSPENDGPSIMLLSSEMDKEPGGVY